ncbi:cold shock domain-containing protein [Sphingobium yanoikuyae]|uniref:Cold shock domain-containing protein n=1 Tax=Sphingobium yanoikuyae TaxID=13690 RepID=A0A6P1GM30_SPHYA|nr:cold shock domain-containing protein [Sphingobium yanoikuyae]QHD69666.1 cold shock domain-containing protein [Sphingobium yanoikuyae]
MPTGTVRYVDRDRGFGFISRDDKQPKVFVHVTAVLEAGYPVLEKGQRWSFDLAEDWGKQVAVNLIAI